MQRDGHDQIPVLAAQRGRRFAQEQAGEERFNHNWRWYLKRWMASSTTPRATTAERAERKYNSISRQFVHSNGVVMSPSNGNPQRPQKRRFDEAHLPPAARANEAVPGGRAFGFAKLADFGIEKNQGRC